MHVLLTLVIQLKDALMFLSPFLELINVIPSNVTENEESLRERLNVMIITHVLLIHATQLKDVSIPQEFVMTTTNVQWIGVTEKLEKSITEKLYVMTIVHVPETVVTHKLDVSSPQLKLIVMITTNVLWMDATQNLKNAGINQLIVMIITHVLLTHVIHKRDVSTLLLLDVKWMTEMHVPKTIVPNQEELFMKKLNVTTTTNVLWIDVIQEKDVSTLDWFVMTKIHVPLILV
jgi:hypothetical protein